MVFYRKYRPQTIEELDSGEVREKLTRILSSKNPGHAYLFSGPKGLGKTSTARIVAKSLNCERKGGSKPCNKCDQCISITNGTNLDVLEIDGASNRGIDEIRDLREKVRLSAVKASRKVYIIDEVHMLTAEAFNALLKTLEEPPSHVVFILCTTEPHKVPATILSRCLHIQFKKATQEELVRSFERIIKAEKIKADKEGLNLIAGLSDGSFRDGVKILEEMVLSKGRKKITKELVEQKYNMSNVNYQIEEMIGFLEKKDAKRGLTLTSQLAGQGVDIKYFMEELIQSLHGLLLQKVGVRSKEEFSIFNFQFSIDEIRILVGLLSKAIGELKYAVLPQLPLELLIVEWSLQQARNHADANAEPRGSTLQRSLVSGSAPVSDKKMQDQNNVGLLQDLIKKVKVYNHSLAGVLRGCRVKSYDDKELVIETGFKFHKQRLDEAETRALIAKAVWEIAGKKIEVDVLLKER